MAEAPSSSWYSSCRKHNRALDVHLVTESDMEAAQQLMQLSDEENSNNINGGKTTTSKCKRNKRRSSLGVEEEEEEVDQKPSNDDIVMAKIQEIFGKDIEDFPSKKQRRYRSLVNIYMATRPIDNAAANEKKERVIGY